MPDKQPKDEKPLEAQIPSGLETVDRELDDTLYARHQEIETLEQLAGKDNQLGTPIPALFSVFYKFIQNPSTVSVETYKRMVDTDDTIGSGVDFLTTCLAARLGRYQHPSKEITDFVNKSLENIDNGFFNVVKEILSASWVGFSVSEKVWANTDKGFVPKKIVALPPSTILFETDRTGEITEDGILQYQRNYNPAFLGAGYYSGSGFSNYGFAPDAARPDMFAKLGDLPYPMRSANTFNYLSVRIPKLKCIHYSFDAQGKFGNPYGRSLLRRAYKYYVVKDAILQMMSVALDRKGTPLTIVYADPNTTLNDPNQAKRTGGAGGSRGNTNTGITADKAAQQAFARVHNDTTIVLPGKKGEIFETDFVPQDSNTEAFIAALDFCNKSILRALLIPTLIFGNGDGSGSFSLGQEHSKTFDKILDGMLAGAKQVLIQQLIREMIAYNFPEQTWKEHGFGDFSKREFTQEELDKISDMYDKAITMGVVDVNDLNDLNQMRETLGFEPRTEIIEQPNPFGEGAIDPETGLPIENPIGGEPGEKPFGAETDPLETQAGSQKDDVENDFARREAERKKGRQNNPADNFRK